MSAVQLVRYVPGGFDVYGDPAGDVDDIIDVPGAWVYPRRRAAELGPTDDRASDGLIDGLTVILPYGTDIRHSDRIDVDGIRYRQDGVPGRWKHPMTGWKAGIELALTRAEGV